MEYYGAVKKNKIMSHKDMMFIFMAALQPRVYRYCIFFIQSIIDGHLGWFQVFAIVNSAAMNIRVHVSL